MRGQILANLLNEKCPEGRGAEVGVWYGQHAHKLLQHWRGELLLIDIYAHDQRFLRPSVLSDGDYQRIYTRAREHLAPFKDRIEWLVGESTAMATSVPNESLDFVYIDAAHDYASVKADLTAWYPKVKEGGWCLGHDYTTASFEGLDNMAPVHILKPVSYAEMLKLPYGVKYAVDEFAVSKKHVVVHHGFNWGFLKE